MTNPGRSHEQLATSDQAKALLGEIGTITALHGEQLRVVHMYSSEAVFPPKVAEHIAEAQSSSEVKDTMYVSQEFDEDTGHPVSTGVVALVKFMRAEKIDDFTSRWSGVSYNIESKDGKTYDISREVTGADPSPRKHTEYTKPQPEEESRVALEGLREALRKAVEAKNEEKATGFSDVTYIEAEQIIQYIVARNTVS